MAKTAEDMKLRLSFLNGLLKSENMTLSTSAERDAILNYGLSGWNDYLSRKRARAARKSKKNGRG